MSEDTLDHRVAFPYLWIAQENGECFTERFYVLRSFLRDFADVIYKCLRKLGGTVLNNWDQSRKYLRRIGNYVRRVENFLQLVHDGGAHLRGVRVID